jgi:hypothetical protein
VKTPPHKKGNQMKELEIAIKQLKSAMKNIDLDDIKLWLGNIIND